MAEKENVLQDLDREDTNCCHRHYKATPRSEAELRQLQNRLKRMMGQLSGISRMLDENRYCGDILIQIAAIESALQAFGYQVLQDHLETCVVEEIQKGNTQVIDEAVSLIKKLK
ncbi:MAG TPA: metal-sensing transcriptional repressor [Candidatus Gallacutalibacter stercoravium]|nr:metal-sensing transcriptional repressor [Candidatus Gallacutalibacter stercoravium]